MQDRTIAFLMSNMKEMEIELRAQSIALDALGEGIIEISELQNALRMARTSEAMLQFVEKKYDKLKLALPGSKSTATEEEVTRLMKLYRGGESTH
jgi:hypothetical protein